VKCPMRLDTPSTPWETGLCWTVEYWKLRDRRGGHTTRKEGSSAGSGPPELQEWGSGRSVGTKAKVETY
jgi:hypothetical protein